MLASLMPGLREIRTPLAVGYAWMLVSYLAFAYRVPDTAHATGPLADLYRIGQLATPVGVAAAASVVAYLVGVAVLRATSTLTKAVLRWRRVTPYWLSRWLPGASPDDQIVEAFESVRLDRLADRIRDDADFRAAVVRHGVEVGRFTGAQIDEARLEELLRKHAAVRREAVDGSLDDGWRQLGELDGLLPLMVQRMRGQDEHAAAEYDRLTTESEFRTGMAWPLLALLVVVAVRASPWWLVCLPAVPLLIASGSSASFQATMLLKTIIAARRYDEPVVQVLDSVPAQQLLSRRATTADWASQAARVVTAVAVNPDHTMVAGGTDDGYLQLWDLSTGEPLRSLAAHRDQIDAVEFSRDGARLVTLGADGAAHVWDPASGERVRSLEQRPSMWRLAVDRSTGLLVGATYDSIVYWDLEAEAPVRRRPFAGPSISGMSMSPDGTLVVGLTDDSVVVIRDDEIVQTVKTGNLIACGALNGGQFVGIQADRDNQYRLVSWRSSDTAVSSTVMAVPREPFPPLVVTDQGGTPKLVYTTIEGDIMALRLDGDPVPQLCGHHEGYIEALAVSTDSAVLVSASRAGTVRVHEFSTGKTLLRLVPSIQTS